MAYITATRKDRAMSVLPKGGSMKTPWRRRLTSWRKHALYGGAAMLGVGLAALTTRGHESEAESFAQHYASSQEQGDRAARIIRADERRDLPGPRSPAFYGHRYSHVLPRGAYEAAMRHGTPQQAAAGFVP